MVSLADIDAKTEAPDGAAETSVERLANFANNDLSELSDAADAAIADGGGFGWLG